MTSRLDSVASPGAFSKLAAALEGLHLQTASTDDSLHHECVRLVATIRSYILPRLNDPPAPLTVVFAGPTGAGKSTLLNSVAGHDLSETGPLRPTTTVPHVYALEDNLDRYRRLGGLDNEVTAGQAPILESMTLVDTPDIDSTARDHREAAEALIDNADIVVFVTSAMRYADRVPWEVLRRARSRGSPVICVLNRIRFSADGALHDYRRLLESEGLSDHLVAIGEHHLETGARRVPAGSIRQLRRRLVGLVETHRGDSLAITRRVIEATCRDADSIIEAALRLGADELASSPGRHRRLPRPPKPLLEDYPPGSWPVGRLLETAARSRRRARRRAVRISRDTGLLQIERNRLTSAVALHLESWATSQADRTPGEDDHRLIVDAVNGWVGDGATDLHGVRPRSMPFVDLLVAVAAATGAEWPSRILEIMLPGLDLEFVVANRRDALDRASIDATRRLLESGRPEVTASDVMEAARVANRALSEVISTVALVDA